MIFGAKQDTAGGRQAARNGHALGHLAEGGKLARVHRVIRLVRAGQMRHDQLGTGGQDLGFQAGPFTGLESQPVHAGIELDREGLPGPGGAVAEILLGAVQDRNGMAQIGAGHMPREHEDARPLPDRLPHRHRFRGQCDEEILRPGIGKRLRHRSRAQPIAVRLHHPGRPRRRCQRSERAIIGLNGRKIYLKSHAPAFPHRPPRVKIAGRGPDHQDVFASLQQSRHFPCGRH